MTATNSSDRSLPRSDAQRGSGGAQKIGKGGFLMDDADFPFLVASLFLVAAAVISRFSTWREEYAGL